MQKCYSFEKNSKAVKILFLLKGTTKCNNDVPSKRNNKEVKMLFLQKGTSKCKNCINEKIYTKNNLHKQNRKCYAHNLKAIELLSEPNARKSSLPQPKSPC